MANLDIALDSNYAKQLPGVFNSSGKGDFTVRMPDDFTGIAGKIPDSLNTVIETEQQLNGGVCGSVMKVVNSRWHPHRQVASHLNKGES